MQQIADLVIQRLQGQGAHLAPLAAPPEDDVRRPCSSPLEVDDGGWYESQAQQEACWAGEAWYNNQDGRWDASSSDPETGWWDPAAWDQCQSWKKGRRKTWHVHDADKYGHVSWDCEWPQLQSKPPEGVEEPMVEKRKVIGPQVFAEVSVSW